MTTPSIPAFAACLALLHAGLASAQDTEPLPQTFLLRQGQVEAPATISEEIAATFPIDDQGLHATVLLKVPGRQDHFTVYDRRSGAELPCRVVARDGKTGLTLIQIDPSDPRDPRDPGALQLDAPPFTIGSSLDGLKDRSLRLRSPWGDPKTARLLGREISYLGEPFAVRVLHFNFEADTRNVPGTPILDDEGRVVAVVLSRSAGRPGIEGVPSSFALPCEVVSKVRSNFQAFGRVETGWLGLKMDQRRATPVILEVTPNGPCALVGLRTGDVIRGIGEREIHRLEDIVDASYFLTPGVPIQLTCVRGIEEMEIELVPGRPPGAPLLVEPAEPLPTGGGAEMSPSGPGQGGADSAPPSPAQEVLEQQGPDPLSPAPRRNLGTEHGAPDSSSSAAPLGPAPTIPPLPEELHLAPPSIEELVPEE